MKMALLYLGWGMLEIAPLAPSTVCLPNRSKIKLL